MSIYIFLIIVLAVLAAAIFIAMKSSLVISDKAYDRLKWIGEKFCPAFNVFILAVTKYYNIPGGCEAAGIIAAFQVFLLALLNNANETYKATSPEEFQIAREQQPGYVGERFYTDEDGDLLIEEDCDE